MSGARYVRNSAGLQQLLEGEPMGHAMTQIAHDGLAIFETIAPRRTSRYATSAEVIETIDAAPIPRRVANLVASAEHAATVEWGNRRGHDPHHTLAHVADTLESGA